MDEPDIRDLIERGSLGTPEAKAIRATVSTEDARRVIRLARYLETVTACPDGHEWCTGQTSTGPPLPPPLKRRTVPPQRLPHQRPPLPPSRLTMTDDRREPDYAEIARLEAEALESAGAPTQEKLNESAWRQYQAGVRAARRPQPTRPSPAREPELRRQAQAPHPVWSLGYGVGIGFTVLVCVLVLVGGWQSATEFIENLFRVIGNTVGMGSRVLLHGR